MIKIPFFIFLLVGMFCLNATAQNDTSTTKVESRVFYVVEKMPKFPGGEAELTKFLQNNIVYPNAAKEKGIEGKVYTQFIINEDGEISDVTILRGIGYGCDDEAIRIVRLMPKWNAGMQGGIPVKVFLQLPIQYTLR